VNLTDEDPTLPLKHNKGKGPEDAVAVEGESHGWETSMGNIGHGTEDNFEYGF